jgi:hypothetical protein
MKGKGKLILGMACLFLVGGFPGAGFPWGDAPTHFSISYDAGLRANLAPDHLLTFVQASACPDLANTFLFRSTDRTYIHEEGFAEAMFYVAEHPHDRRWKRYWKPRWLATAQGWQAHLAADEVAHSEYVPEEQVLHDLVEFEVDVCVYYEKPAPSVPGVDSWQKVNVCEDCYDPWLLYWASYIYTKGKKPVYPWMTKQALETLKTAIQKEYELIASRGGPERAEGALRFLVPGKDWETYYNAAVDEVAALLPE